METTSAQPVERRFNIGDFVRHTDNLDMVGVVTGFRYEGDYGEDLPDNHIYTVRWDNKVESDGWWLLERRASLLCGECERPINSGDYLCRSCRGEISG